MADFKPLVAPERVAAVVREELGEEARGLRLLKGGQLSQAFAFGTDAGEFVVRFNADPVGFLRDGYAAEHFASPSLPIPRVIRNGTIDGLAFAITEFVPGEHLHARPPGEYLRLLPLALDALDALHRIEPGEATGYGPWRGPGRGLYPTWQRFLAGAIEEETEGFFAGWHRLFDESFLERDLYEAIYRRMLALVEFCPEERWILHGDFGFDNVLADEQQITGVLDWGTLSYGDFVYDLARIDFFSASEAVTELLRRRYATTTPQYAERLACYRCWTGLGALRFYAMANQRPIYEWAKQQIARHLAD